MAKRLNHENLSFKLSKPHESWGTGFERQPMSIMDIQKEIDECDICQKMGCGFCVDHMRMIQGRKDLFNTAPNKKT